MSKKVISFLMLAVLGVLLSAADAQAWYRFKNGTNTTVWVAFQWYSPNCSGSWETEGWWELAPGETKTVFGANLQSTGSRYYYFYAEGADGRVWGGPYETCAPIQEFNWCLNTCNTSNDTIYYGFREKYIGKYNNYTSTLK